MWGMSPDLSRPLLRFPDPDLPKPFLTSLQQSTAKKRHTNYSGGVYLMLPHARDVCESRLNVGQVGHLYRCNERVPSLPQQPPATETVAVVGQIRVVLRAYVDRQDVLGALAAHNVRWETNATVSARGWRGTVAAQGWGYATMNMSLMILRLKNNSGNKGDDCFFSGMSCSYFSFNYPGRIHRSYYLLHYANLFALYI